MNSQRKRLKPNADSADCSTTEPTTPLDLRSIVDEVLGDLQGIRQLQHYQDTLIQQINSNLQLLQQRTQKPG